MPQFVDYFEIGITLVVIIFILVGAIRSWNTVKEAEKRLALEKDGFQRVQKDQKQLIGEMENVPESLGETSVYQVLRTARVAGTVDTSTLVYSDWIQSSRFYAGIFVFIGLAGTVFGIGIGMFTLGALLVQGVDLLDKNPQKLQDAVMAIVKALGIASWCTFSGILATIVLSIRNSGYLQAVNTFETRVQEYALMTLLPSFQSDTKAKADTALRQVLKETQKEWVETLAGALRELKDAQQEQSRQITETLDATSKTATDSQRQLGQLLSNSLTALNTSQQDQTDQITAVMRQVNSQFSSALNQFDQRIDDGMSSVKTAVQAAKDTMSEVNAALRPTAEIFQQAGETVKQVAETLEQSRGQIDTSTVSLTNALVSGRSQLETVANSIQDGIVTLQGGNQSLSTVATRLESIAVTINSDREATLNALRTDRESTLEVLVKDRTEALEALTQERSAALTALTQDREKTTAAFDALFNTVKPELERAQEMSRTAADSYQRLHNLLQETDTRRQTHEEQFLRNLQDTSGQFVGSLTQLKETLDTGYQSLYSVTAQIESITRTLGEDRKEMLQGLAEDRTKTFAGFVAERNALISRVESESARAQEAARTALASGERLYQLMEANNQQRQSNDGQFIARLQDAGTQLTGSLGKWKEALDSGYQSLNTATTQLTSITSALSTDRNEVLQAIREDRKTNKEDLLANLETTSKALVNERDALLDAVKLETQKAQDISRTTTESYNRLVNQLSKNSQERHAEEEDFVSTLKTTSDKLSEMLARFEETLTEIAVLSEQKAVPQTLSDLKTHLDTSRIEAKTRHAEITTLLQKQTTPEASDTPSGPVPEVTRRKKAASKTKGNDAE